MMINDIYVHMCTYCEEFVRDENFLSHFVAPVEYFQQNQAFDRHFYTVFKYCKAVVD